MKILLKIVTGLLFIIFFGFALKNTQEVALRFFWDYEIRGPLVLLLLGFFVLGAVIGVMAMTPTVIRHRRDASRQRIALANFHEQQQAEQLARAQPPQPDSVPTQPF